MTHRYLRLAAALLTLSAIAVLPGFIPRLQSQAQTGIVAIRNATLLTATRGTIQNGTIVLQNGKIAAIGTNVTVPAGAELVDGTGKFVSPGLIDCHSHIANDDINEGGTSVSSMVGMSDVLNPSDINIYRDLAGGTTTANILHGSANSIGGKTLVIKLRYGKKRPEDIVFEGAPPGIKFALGENVTQKRGQTRTPPERFPATRQGVDYVMRDAFVRAKAYKKALDDYAAKGKGQDLLPPKRDLQLDPLVEVLEGKRLVHVHSYRADEILMMIRVADEMGFKVATFQHVLEGYKVAKEIAASGARASTFSDWWGYKIEAVDAIPYNAAIMTRKGVSVSINSDDAEQARRLNNEAAKTIRYGGLTDDEALATITINPAKQLQIDKRVGSLEVGKDADVVIWNHHPLNTEAIVDRAYIDGIVYYDRAKDLDRIAAIEKEKGSTHTETSGTDGSSTPGAAQAAAPLEQLNVRTNATGPAWAITNARIVTVSGTVVPHGTVVIKGNRIDAVGENVTVPSGAKVVDAAGANVYPGFIDAATDIGLNEPGPRSYDDVSEIGDWNQALRTQRAFKADSDAIPVGRVEGITTIGVAPASGVISGSMPVMNLDGWTWEETTLRPSAGLVMAFPGGGGGGRGGGGRGGAPTGGPSPQEQIARLTALLERASAYARQPAGHAIDLSLEPFVPVLNRSQALIVSAGTEQAIRDAVNWAEKQHVRIVIRSSSDAQRAAAFLKEHDVPVILASILTLPPREDEFHAYPYEAPGVLAKAGVRFAFSSGGYQFSRNVPFQAGRAVAWGLDHDAAIRALTLDAARILGVDSQVGSIEPGKLANLVVMKGDALEIRSQIQHVVIAGRDVPLDSRHTELYKRYMARE